MVVVSAEAGNGNNDEGDGDRGASGNGDDNGDDGDHRRDGDNSGDGGATAGAGDGNSDARDADRGAGSIAKPHPKTNFSKLSRPELTDAARRQQAQARRLHWEKFVCCSKLAAAQARVRTWRERARSAAGRGELRTVTDELTLAYQKGHFKGRRALWHFISDLIHASAAEPDKNGNRRKLHWHEGTHRLFGMLRKIGGPRTQRFLVQNLGGPDEHTSRKRWNKRRFLYQPGINEATFSHLEARYTEARASLPYKGKVLCEAAEDETNILADLRYSAKLDAATGT